MTEAEWLECNDPGGMLDNLPSEVSERRLRLFACACCRSIWMWLSPSSRHRLERAEQRAEGVYDPDALEWIPSGGDPPGTCAVVMAAGKLRRNDLEDVADWARWCAAIGEVENDDEWNRDEYSEMDEDCYVDTSEKLWQAEIVCDIFGNPFRPAAFSAEWRTDTAVTLARQMYESRDFSAMPILADALQDAGCDSDDILTHCRSNGPHVRGCWVVDLVLGKE